MAKDDGYYISELNTIENHDLLIIHDFGLQTINNEKQMIIMDLAEDRNQNGNDILLTATSEKLV